MFNDIDFNDVYKAIFSSPRKESKYRKGVLKRIENEDKVVFQIELFTLKQAFHFNYSIDDISLAIEKLLLEDFSQLSIYSSKYIYGFKYTSKGHLLNNRVKNTEKVFLNVSHNKEKNYLLKEGIVVPPLVDLSVMREDGMVVKAHYDKYRQINHFLEILDDTIKDLDKDNINIIDFGCGKSYLTFIVYYYLKFVKKINVNMVGLDLKEDVINNCNSIAKKYGYSNLHFEIGDISLYKPKTSVDMIITLHACDVATDFAMYHAIKLKTKYLLSVPCCQHEINTNLNKNNLKIINKYGLLKERFSSLLTDSIRANILENEGYKVQVMEFVDFASSPKNVLIRAVYDGKRNEESIQLVNDILKEYKIEQTLYNLLYKK